MGTSILLLFCVGLSITAGWMVFAWVIARLLNNLSIVDAAWAMAFLPTSFFLVLFDSDPTFSSYLLTVLMVCWSLRLSVHISFRIFKHHPQEDPRYRPLRQMFSKNEWLIYLVFFQLQGFVVALLLLPLIVTIVCGPRELSLFQFLATTLAFLSIGGEWLADWQLSNFKSKSNEPKAICKNGLWAWSRHPNYFFEWLFWVSVSLYVLPMHYGWIGLAAPAMMLWFLLRLTGIPATEAYMLETRGEAFKQYCRETSPFIPLPPRVSTVE